MRRNLIWVFVVAVLVIGIVAYSNFGMTGNMVEGDYGDYDVAVFAGGCFWCMEAAFEELEGVIEVISGYTGGGVEGPSYEQVISGKTGHYEAVQIFYDSSVVSYDGLLDYYWRQIDPLDSEGQFSDKGSQYLTAIFYLNDEQKVLAEKSKTGLQESGKLDGEIVTEIFPASEFYEAEEYHQDFYKKRYVHYNLYKEGSGRPQRLNDLWGG